MSSYIQKQISEWSNSDLCNWLLDNKFRGISELFQNFSINGYDLFYINNEILKNELGLNSFHERNVALKLITKLQNEHLKLNIINSNGDNLILTLDNNHETSLGDLNEYIGNIFNIDTKYIIFKDSTKQEVLSPTIKIVKLLILYPKIYKTIYISNMKEYYTNNEELIGSVINQEGKIENNDNNSIGSMEQSMNERTNMNKNNQIYKDEKKNYNNNYNKNIFNNQNINNNNDNKDIFLMNSGLSNTINNE